MTETKVEFPAPPVVEARNNTLWTVWCDYGATGEGRTIMALICYATSKEEAELEFQKQFGTYYVVMCESEHGVVRNSFTKHLFSENLLTSVEKANGKAMVRLMASSYFNFN